MTSPFARRVTWRGWSAPAIDGAIALGAAVVVVTGTRVLTGGRGIDLPGYLLLVTTALPLVARRARPLPVLAATVLVSSAYVVAGYPSGFFTLPMAVALYSAVDAGFRWRATAVAAGAVAVFGVVGMGLGRGHVTDLANAAWFAGWLAVSLVLGEVTRSRRAYLEQVEQRALEAERTREEEALRRAGEERIRIARELHDVLAHRISSINVQAGVGAHLLDRDPEQARKSLLAIAEASREALQELRTTLGVLRQVDDPEPRAPVPGLAQLPGLVADARAAGVSVTVEVAGEPRELPGGVDLAAYRIVEEALTNVVRHARAARARVGITYGQGNVAIEVDDDGVGTPDTTGPVEPGNGLLGMRERAATLGGSLEAGPGAAGGFHVAARLPIQAGS